MGDPAELSETLGKAPFRPRSDHCSAYLALGSLWIQGDLNMILLGTLHEL